MSKKLNLAIVYAEISQGSSSNFCDGKPCFIKHFNSLDNLESEDVYERAFESAVARKVPTREEKESDIIERGLWTDAKTKRIEELEPFIETLKVTKSRYAFEAQRRGVTKQIEEAEKELFELQSTRASLMNVTAESFGTTRKNNYLIFRSFFEDKECKTPLFSQQEYQYIDDVELNKITDIFIKNNMKFEPMSIKKLAVSGEFLNNFYLCEDNPYTFFGKPVCLLTHFQVQLFTYGRMYKNILSNGGKITKEVLENPDKLIEWNEKNKNVKEVMARHSKEGEQMSMPGSTREELESMGIKTDNSQLDEMIAKAAKSGGKLNMNDILKMGY